jgi:type IV pilus assembly protein PilY1
MKRVLSCVFAGLSALPALAVDLADVPIFLGGTVAPNVMLLLDDRPGTSFERFPYRQEEWDVPTHLFPDQKGTSTSTLSRWKIDPAIEADHEILVPDFAEDNPLNYYWRSAANNPLFYDPSKTYEPWVDRDGVSMKSYDPLVEEVPFDPGDTARKTLDLLFPGQVNASALWVSMAGTGSITVINDTDGIFSSTDIDASAMTCVGEPEELDLRTSIFDDKKTCKKKYWPITYYVPDPTTPAGLAALDKCYYLRVQITSGPTATVSECDASGVLQTQIVAVLPSGRTAADEARNFANWFAYHRSFHHLERGAVTAALASLESTVGNQFRLGLATTMTSNAVARGIEIVSDASVTSVLDLIYPMPLKSTTGLGLARAFSDVGNYFDTAKAGSPWAHVPGDANSTEMHSCRQSYTLLVTDGQGTTDTVTIKKSGQTTINEQSIVFVDDADGKPGAAYDGEVNGALTTSTSYTPARPYTDGAISYANTLADVAMAYWKTDLIGRNVFTTASDLSGVDADNDVPTISTDPAYWQHMVTYVVTLDPGNFDPDKELADIKAGVKDWPKLGGVDTRTHDLLHAAVNGHGEFFLVSDPGSLALSLRNALGNVASRNTRAGLVGVSGPTLEAGSQIFQANFSSEDWTGSLLAFEFDGNDFGAQQWDAGQKINEITAASRVAITHNGADGVPFRWGNISAAQQGLLNTADANGTADALGSARLDWLRGDRSMEGTNAGDLRARPRSLLGDIVNSSPLYIGPPDAGYSDVDYPGYAQFASDFKDREPVVWVGANDLGLHGFKAEDGAEVLAYVPGPLYANLARLSDQVYSHRYFTDGSPFAADAKLEGGDFADSTWRTVLVSGLNKGGRGYFALDVTDPATFTEANAADRVLWEFTDADDVDLGYTFNQPPVNRLTKQARQIAKMANGKWAAIVGNGYNAPSGRAALYILFIADGTDGWAGGDFIKLVAGTSTTSGLSTPYPFDSDGDGDIDIVYAGDIEGRLWRFDVANGDPTKWTAPATPLFETPYQLASDRNNYPQPFGFTSLEATLHPLGGVLVLGGTGKYLGASDNEAASFTTQSFYGIWDAPKASTTVTRAELLAQTFKETLITANGVTGIFREVSVNQPDWFDAGTNPTGHRGWVLDLVPDPAPNSPSGERVVGRPLLMDGVIDFSTYIPPSNIPPAGGPCDFGGGGYEMRLDYLTGAQLSFAVFDTDLDGIVTDLDAPTGGAFIGASVGGTSVVGIGDLGATRSISNVMQDKPKDAGCIDDATCLAGRGAQGETGRVSWRELVD